MSWQDKLIHGGATWDALIAYVQERIAFHTKICVSRSAPEPDVRASQAAIEELQRLVTLPARLAMEMKSRQ